MPSKIEIEEEITLSGIEFFLGSLKLKISQTFFEFLFKIMFSPVFDKLIDTRSTKVKVKKRLLTLLLLSTKRENEEKHNQL